MVVFVYKKSLKKPKYHLKKYSKTLQKYLKTSGRQLKMIKFVYYYLSDNFA